MKRGTRSTKTNLHIMDMDKFIPPFIKLIEEHSFTSEQIYFISGEVSQSPATKRGRVVLSSFFSRRWARFLWLVKAMNSADKIVLHGLFNLRIVILLFLQPWLLRRSYWLLWGGDLYKKQLPRNFRWYVSEFFRYPVIKYLGYIVAGVPGDFSLVKDWYGTRAAHIECLIYPSNMYTEYPVVFQVGCSLNVQVGNSADPSNNHLEVFEKLEQFRDLNIQVYVPLAYGDDAHRKLVLAEGERRFGDRFKPLLNLLSFSEYLDFLAMVDVAIFAHHRQQAFGNKVTLLGLGKKVVFRKESTLWDVFKKRNVIVYDFSNFNLERLPAETANHNREQVKMSFSKEALLASLDWMN